MSIQTFSDKNTEEFFLTEHTRKGIKYTNVSQIAMRKLDTVHYATKLDDLRAPSGNKLEMLKGDLKCFYSI